MSAVTASGASSQDDFDPVVVEAPLWVGAGVAVAICGDVMTRPGLPKAPASEKIDGVDGQIVGLF